MKRNKQKIYSFDIFDTCFVRTCGAPHNVFDLLAYHVLSDNNSESVRVDFALARIEGEQKARALSGKEEVTLEDIYACCDFTGLTTMPNTEIANVEMEVERKLLVSVYAVRKQIEELHQRGCIVYYISDMYLPQSFLQELLIEHGLWQVNDKLYVSSACGKTKRTGNLYKHIAEENKRGFGQWIHQGDNRHSDYRIPRRLGIKATLVNHKYSVYEYFLFQQDFFPGFFVNQHLAGISKAVRLSFPGTSQYAFAADLVALLYVPFVYHILQDAVNNDIRRVFFLARDGYILYHIAQELQEMFPHIEVKYLYVSRSSLYFPGMREITPESLASLTKTEFGFTNENRIEILENFIVPEVLEQVKNIASEKTEEDMFFNPDILQILSQYHKEQQDYIREYFIQEQLADSCHKTAVVDVIGTRSCHQAINSILAMSGFPPVKGYYLEVLANRKQIKDTGDYDSLYYKERFYVGTSLMYISELGAIFEQYFSISPHLRTVAYKKDGYIQPVFEENEVDCMAKGLVECHEKVVTMYARLFTANKLYLHLPHVLQLATSQIAYFSKKPIYRYLTALYAVRTNNQKGKYRYIVKRLSPIDLLRKNVNWWRGAIFYSLRTVLFSDIVNYLFFFSKRVYIYYKRYKNKWK